MTASSTSTEPLQTRGQQPVLASQREKAQGGKSANKSGYFPLSYKDGFSQWWASVSPAMAEHAVMSYVPYLRKPPTQMQSQASSVPHGSSSSESVNANAPNASESVETTASEDPHGPRLWHSNLVQLSGKNRVLNELSIERVNEPVEENLVMLHGYGAGLGFFYKNFEGLSRVKGWKIYALDMLGMGRSSRPAFKVHAKDRQGKIDEAENWFIDALEEWRIKKNIDKFTLLGHSMGGYMATAYALKYPGRLKKLILASPVGIPEDPYAVSADLPEPEESTMAEEFTQDQDTVVKNGDKKATKEAPKRPYPKILTYLWDANFSPFSFVRWSGPLGPRFVSGWSSRRFSHLPAEEAEALHTYSYSLFRQRGSGEYALAYILAPGAFARSPLLRRIHKVGRQPLPAGQSNGTVTKETGIPILMMYGDNDWMDVGGGYAAEQKLKEEKEKVLSTATEEEKRLENGRAEVIVIKKSGHHVYLDGWEEFNEIMRKEMKRTSEDSKRLKLDS